LWLVIRCYDSDFMSIFREGNGRSKTTKTITNNYNFFAHLFYFMQKLKKGRL
jgi:hypothetical protein